jgi:hypothetical protein
MFRSKFRALGIVLAVVLVASVLVVSYQARRALVASHTMVMGKVTTQLVRDYVMQHHRWPQSWDDLRSIQVPPPFNQSGHFIDTAQTRVVIDFTVTLQDLETLTVEDFTAIRPRGYAHPGYKEYWEFESLLEACRSAANDKKKQK